MLTEIFIEALLVNEELADQVWEAWNAGEIDDLVAAWAWWLISIRSDYVGCQAIWPILNYTYNIASIKPNPPKDGDGKPRVLASSEKPRMTPPRTPRTPSCRHTWTGSMKAFARFLCVLSLAAICVACGGGGGGAAPTPQPPVVNASPGGIWEGIDSDGDSVVALVTETGRFHFIDEFGNQGSGILNVSNGNDVSGNFQFVTPFGITFPDGTTLADCTLSGTVTERGTMTVTVNCTTTAGLQDLITVTLNYNVLYERDSSLATIAGMYDDGSGIVTEIASDGTISEQDPVSGCVTNGQVSVIDIGAFNLYDVEFGFSNCTGQFAIFNGTSFVGLATLDNTVAPEALIVAATGDVAGTLVSFFSVSERLPPQPPPPPPPPPSQNPRGLWDGQAVTVAAADVFTSFEFNATGGFSFGTSPYTVDFSSGDAQTVGNPLFYKSGTHSWHILNATSATVTFETLPNTLTFHVIRENAAVMSEINIRDESGALLLNVVPTDVFQMVSVTGNTLIGSVEVTGAGGGNIVGGDVIIDDLTFGYSGAGFAGSTDDVDCLVADTLEFTCTLSDPATGDLLASAQGTVQVAAQNVISGSGMLYAVPGSVLADGSAVANLTISAGTISQASTLDLTVEAAGTTSTITTTYDAIYERGSDLATIAAVYTTFDIFGDPSSFTIDATGVITGNSAAGCVLNGQVSIIDAVFNAYDVALDITSCGGLNGMYDGLGLTQDSVAMDDLFIFAAFTAQSTIVGEAEK